MAVAPGWRKRLHELDSHAAVGETAVALEIFEEIQASVPVAQQTMLWNTVLKAFANVGDFEGAEAWHRKACEAGVPANRKTFGKLAEAAAKAGRIPEAVAWLEVLQATPGLVADKVTYSTVIDACAKAGNASEATRWLGNMAAARVALDLVSYNTVINAFAKASDAAAALAFLKAAASQGLEPDRVSYSAVIEGYSADRNCRLALASSSAL